MSRRPHQTQRRVLGAFDDGIHRGRAGPGRGQRDLERGGAHDRVGVELSPAVQRDLEAYLSRLVPDGDALYTHRAEGEDDMPSHVKAALTRTSEQVPVQDGEPMLGSWQGIYVWEHRKRGHRREVIVHVIGS